MTGRGGPLYPRLCECPRTATCCGPRPYRKLQCHALHPSSLVRTSPLNPLSLMRSCQSRCPWTQRAVRTALHLNWRPKSRSTSVYGRSIFISEAVFPPFTNTCTCSSPSAATLHHLRGMDSIRTVNVASDTANALNVSRPTNTLRPPKELITSRVY